MKYLVGFMLFISVHLYAGNLERDYNFEKEVYKIIQNGSIVGYAQVGPKYDGRGGCRVSVINITGTRKYVSVKNQNGAGMSMYVDPGSLRKNPRIGLIAENPETFDIDTNSFCGYGLWQITFTN